jgi:predicted NAD/FAD-dependent oxidoreductase
LALWNQPDHELTEFASEYLEAKIGAVVSLGSVVKRWRYAGPVQVLEESAFLWGNQPLIAMAGEAFNGPKVEGAFDSGRYAAEKIAELLS